MMRGRVSATWCSVVVLLCGAGCEHAPDVVANISEIEMGDAGVSPPATPSEPGSHVAGSSGGNAAAGKGGMTGTPVGPSGSGGGAGNESDAGRDAGAGGESEAGSGGAGEGGMPGVSGVPGSVEIQGCELIYRGVAEVVEDECVIEPDTPWWVIAFLETSLVVEIPMAESQPFSPCAFLGQRIYTDERTKVRMLCEYACDAARKWLAAREQMHNCPYFQPDNATPGERAGSGGAGSGGTGAGDAGSDS